MRRILVGIAVATLSLAFLAIAIGAIFLIEAHWEIRSLEPAIPERAALAVLAGVPDAPVRVGYLNTATQHSAGIAHIVFLLEWADGRLFAIDAGMEREGAEAFSRPFELLLGADPIEPHGSPGELLGADAKRIEGVAFTHLHADHTGGLASLCQGQEQITVFQTPWQADRGNYTTSPGREDIAAAPCVRTERLAPAAGAGPIHPVPGFPGLVAIPAGGHTPGSTVYAAPVTGTLWIFSGDITNRRAALLDDVPKEWLYSLLIVPEAPGPLSKLRVWLAGLDAQADFRVVVSHDLVALRTSGPPAWPVGGARP